MLNAVELVVSCTRFLILDRFYCEVIYVLDASILVKKKEQDLKEKKKSRIIKKNTKCEAFTSGNNFVRCEE
jgi:hypothetical protein